MTQNTNFFLAGSVSLPDSLWNWERGNKFPINEYGIFKILLYDAYGNKVSASTGSIQPNVQIDATFQRSEINLLSNKSETIVETTPTIKITWQMAYGFCVISVYAKKEGMFKMTVRDNHNIILGNMPTTFYVTPGVYYQAYLFKLRYHKARNLYVVLDNCMCVNHIVNSRLNNTFSLNSRRVMDWYKI